MSRKIARLMLVTSVAAGFGVVPMMVGAQAAEQRSVDVYNMDRGFDSGNDKLHETQTEMGDSVIWYIKEGTHTITPLDKTKWDDEDGSGDLEEGKDYVALFPSAGKYAYYCEKHGSKDAKAPSGVAGMSGLIVVRDPAVTTTTAPPPVTTTQPPTTTTTRPAVPGVPVTTAPAPASSSGTHTPNSAGKAPTTTTAKDKGKKHKDDETTTTTAAPAPTPVDLPDSAIIPALPGSGTTTVQDGAIGDPLSTPQGEAVALLKPTKRSGNGMKLLIASGIGLGALGFGTAGYKFANRSSKYFPA